ncbi:TAXI family TRAP transporter solute-binding subunit [Georgenia sp. Z1344]|uniref:TAXI family TRAP transporter solute-binding subunit n=1 Tax=Georgenia sp. Z1344 TaxID=3416706 RepID=UPI003CF61D08
MGKSTKLPLAGAALTATLALAACGGDTGGLSAPDEDEQGGQSGTSASLATSWGPSDTDWYLYGAESMALIEESSALDITVQESAGSEENAIRMDAGEVDLGMIDVQGAETALGEHELAALYPISIVLWQLVVGADTDAETPADLDGLHWNAGPIGGGSTQITMDALEALGVTPDYYEAGLGDAVSAYAGRQIEGFSYRGAGVQATGAILEASSSRPINLINFADEDIATVQDQNPAIVPVDIPGGTYSDVPNDIQTLGYWGVIVAAAPELSEDVAYEVTAQFWENIDEVNERLPQTEGLTPEVAIDELLLPLHPGAARYYEEQGIDIPEDMIR